MQRGDRCGRSRNRDRSRVERVSSGGNVPALEISLGVHPDSADRCRSAGPPYAEHDAE